MSGSGAVTGREMMVNLGGGRCAGSMGGRLDFRRGVGGGGGGADGSGMEGRFENGRNDDEDVDVDKPPWSGHGSVSGKGRS